MAITRRRISSVGKTLEIPMDIIFDILSRLPVKSLIRFKSVSKTLYNLIKSTCFVKLHQIYSNLNPNSTFNAVLSIVSLGETGKRVFRINFVNALDKPIDLDLPFMSDYTRFSVLNICNGLVCVRLCNDATRSSRIAICNPLTGEFRLVPGIDDDSTYFESTVNDMNYTYFGFGLNGDKGYEFFRMFYKPCPNDEMVLEGEAYSLSTSTWRKIDLKEGDFDHLEDFSKPRASYHPTPVFLRGFFYWAATDFQTGYVVSLDVENEVFEAFLAPNDCSDEGWIICDLDGEVAIVVYHDDFSFDVWVLNEIEKSWELKMEMEEGTKIKDFRSGSVVTVLGRMRSGELVVEDYDKKSLELFLYDMDTDDVEDLLYANRDKKHEVFLYTESLVSINDADDDVTESCSYLPEKKRRNILRM